MNELKNKTVYIKKLKNKGKRFVLPILAVLFFLAAPAFRAYAEEEATPLYEFEYQGAKIETYATYSVVDGVKTDGFRYFVKDGNLLVVDNNLNSAADGVFIHYAGGDSYIGVLTRGGHLVSLGTVDLASKLKNFKNSGISDIVSNVDDDSRTLIISYENGGMVGYDVVTGEELFRRGGTEATKSLTDYITEYLNNMIKSTTTTAGTTARAEADEIAAIMEKEGYTLEELAAGGVFSSTDSLNSFVQNGVLNSSVDPDAAGGTGTGETRASQEATAAAKQFETKAAGTADTETAAAAETSGTDREKETGESKSSTTDVKSSEVLKKNSAAELQEGETKETKASSEKESNKAEKESEEESKEEASKDRKEEESTAAKDKNGKSSTKTESSKVGSAVIQKKDSASGKTSGTKTDGSGQEDGSADGDGEASGTEGKSSSAKTKAGAETETSAADGKKVSETGKSDGNTSGEKNTGQDAADSEKDGQDSGDKKSAGGSSAENEASGNTSDGDGKEGSEGTSGEKKLLAEKSGYVPVYNPDTESYEIYSVSELLENPENPKSENAKLDNADNKAIAALLKVKEDENNERGISLYTVVIAAVAGLMVLAVFYIVKRSGREAALEAEQEAQTGKEKTGK